MDRRLEFLNEFLGALGASEITQVVITPTSVSGTVVYDQGEPEELQDFRWTIGEAEGPSHDVISLARFIRAADLLSIDQLRVSREELLELFNTGNTAHFTSEHFVAVLEELLSIEVPMLDDGVESDSYFIHEQEPN